MFGRSVLCEQICENGQYVIMFKFALNMDGEAFTRVFINDSEHTECTTVMGTVGDKVIRPDMAFVLWLEPGAGAIIKPKPAVLGLLLRDFEPFTSPYAFNAFEVDRPTFSPEQCCNPAIAITAIFRSQTDNIGCQRRFIISDDFRLSLRGAMLAEGLTRTALGTPKRRTYMINGQSATRRASFKIKASRVRLETALRSRWFSFSRSFRRRAWETFKPPYSRRHR